jgi:hypothetical protein
LAGHWSHNPHTVSSQHALLDKFSGKRLHDFLWRCPYRLRS